MPRILFQLSSCTSKYKIGHRLFEHDELEALNAYEFDRLLVKAGHPSCQDCGYMRASKQRGTLFCNLAGGAFISCREERMTGECGISGANHGREEFPEDDYW